MTRLGKTTRFDEKTLERLSATEEIDIETHPAGSDARRTTVWIVVDGGNAYVRAVRGLKGRWYREIRSDSSPAVIARGRRYSVRPVQVKDESEIERVTEAYKRKYGKSRWVSGVLKPETLPATLRLEPPTAA
ncbi:MAG: DUF2255 family protein [Chloroflexi bacterium]|nr:DUF2255 family protein [Chloroflexota bacterium]